MVPEMSTALPVVDLCPLVPAACLVEKGAEVVFDKANPFKSFWDAFFVSSPQEALETPLRLIYGVPQPNFDATWFRDAYSNTLAFYGIGIAVLMFVVSIALASFRSGATRSFLDIFADFFVTLFQIAFMPVFSGVVLMISAISLKAILGWVNVEDPREFLGFFSADYFAVGWMSLLARVLGILLALEVVALYLVQIFATLSAPIIVPLRVAGDAGRMWYVRMIRGILLGFAPLIMGFTLAVFIWALKFAPSVGTSSLFEFMGACAGMMVAGYLPLKISKKSQGIVTNGALRLGEVRFNPRDSLRFALNEPRSAASLQRYMMRKQERHEGVRDAVKDVTKIGLAVSTGGASAGIAAAAAGKSRLAARSMDAFQRTQSFQRQVNEHRTRQGGDRDVDSA